LRDTQGTGDKLRNWGLVLMTRLDGDLGLSAMYIIYQIAWNALENSGRGQNVGQSVMEGTYVALRTYQNKSEM
jgi:hypothetical protein